MMVMVATHSHHDLNVGYGWAMMVMVSHHNFPAMPRLAYDAAAPPVSLI